MRFGVLGPLWIRDGDRRTPVAARRDRVVLAVQLLNANQVVSSDQLVDALWGEQPPSTARAQVHSCVSRLRRLLPDGVLHTDPAGYLLRVGPDELDAFVFETTVARARADAADGRPAEASAGFRAGLALWRGEAFAGVDSPVVRDAAIRWEEQRTRVWEECLEVELGLGRDTELIAELAVLVHRHPTRERLRGQLMLALYRAGRQADALIAYRAAREELAETLGVEPGPELVELHRRILQQDSALGGTGGAPAPSPVEPARCLPRDIADFIGRDELLARLVAAVPDATEVAGAPSVIHAIDGMPGVGKTALAVHLAHLVADRYPDAQLYVDLHGHSEQAPAEPAAALDTLLRQLGVAGERIPEGLEPRIARWRSELAGRRVLLLLDNAATSEQVGALLPGGPGCLTLVTSRARLAGLDGVRPVSLEVLTAGEAVALQHRIVGERIVEAPEAAAEVARQCGYLALAIRLAAARLAHRPAWSVQDLVGRLGAARPALHEIVAEGRSVSAAFALSYRQLGAAEARLLRLLGLHPGTDFDARAVAALADLDVPEAAAVLERLVDAHLLQEPAAGRYRMHDLLREYARGMAEADEPVAAREAAVHRLLDYYLYSAIAMSPPLETYPFDYRLTAPPPRQAMPGDLSGTLDTQTALAWFDAERANMIAAIRLAAELRSDCHVWRLTRSLWRFLFRRGHNDDLISTHLLALRVAQRGGDQYAVAVTRNYLASGYFRQGRYQEAHDQLRAELAYMQETGDRSGEANAFYLMGIVSERLCRYPEALEYLHRSARSRQQEGNELGMALAYSTIGVIHLALGRYPQALAYNARTLEIVQRQGQSFTEGIAYGHIGAAQLRMGRLADAERNLLRAIDLKHQANNQVGEAEVVNDLAVLHRTQGNLEAALACHRLALRQMCDGGERFGECVTRNAFGVTLRLAGDLDAAGDQHRRALVVATRIGNPLEEGRALAGLAELDYPTDPAAAEERWREALKIFTELGVPERDEVADRLSAAG
jgi:DNA-binding SARP family transcriptional activator